MASDKGITVIDLFCGAGGFSMGFHQAGFDVVYGIDNWQPACDTHSVNGLGEVDNLDLLAIDIDGIVQKKEDLESTNGPIDVVIGSPPCTEFSFAKKGGRGDVEKGMLLVRKHLLFVSIFRPKFWLMENVPRLRQFLEQECIPSPDGGWQITYESIGIPRDRFQELGLKGDSLSIPRGDILVASDYGACQNRKRFLSGNFPLETLANHRAPEGTDVSLGGLLSRLNNGLVSAGHDGMVEDPNYPGHNVRYANVRDHFYDTNVHPMHFEEMRFLKRRHIQYGRMSLPDDLSSPARTIMATFNSSSREAILLETGNTVVYQGKERPVYRQPTVREVACIQGFPLDFQLKADRLASRYKLVGNAVPCQLSYSLALSILDGASAVKGMYKDGFDSRVDETIDRRRRNGNNPIMPRPKQIIEEAKDIDKGSTTFKGSDGKRIRRKIISSKIESDSSVVILENWEEGDRNGHLPIWKACLQNGVGGTYSKVYLDRTSIELILKHIMSRLDSENIRAMGKWICDELDHGVPVVTPEWEEFPGYSFENMRKYSSFVGRGRLSIPSARRFQELFTKDIPDLEGEAGPLDLFDGIDALILKGFMEEGFRPMSKEFVHIDALKDDGGYPADLDKRIVREMMDIRLPIPTVIGCILAIRLLSKMYGNAISNNAYATSLLDADRMISNWITE